MFIDALNYVFVLVITVSTHHTFSTLTVFFQVLGKQVKFKI